MSDAQYLAGIVAQRFARGSRVSAADLEKFMRHIEGRAHFETVLAAIRDEPTRELVRNWAGPAVARKF